MATERQKRRKMAQTESTGKVQLTELRDSA